METPTALRNRVNRVTHTWFGDFPCNLLLLHRLKCKLFPDFTHKTSVNNLALHRMFIYHLHPHDIWWQQAISFSTDSWDMKYSTIYNSVSFFWTAPKIVLLIKRLSLEIFLQLIASDLKNFCIVFPGTVCESAPMLRRRLASSTTLF